MANYTGLNASERSFDTSPTVSNVTKVPGTDGVDRRGSETKEQAVIRTRAHPILCERDTQLGINILGLYGGRPYIRKRLARFPGEPELMFKGGTNRQGKHISGRLQQTHVLPYLGRIAQKINQFVFGPGVEREGAKAEVVYDIDRKGKSVDQFMRDVSEMLTACGWCWIAIDAPVVTQSTTVADVQSSKIRPYWMLYKPTEVIDWHFDELGKLEWLLAEGVGTKSDDPKQEREVVRRRSLWTRTSVTHYWYGKDKDEIERQEELPHGFGVVPFIPVGLISAEPIIFDSLEGVNKTIMDLMSANRQNYFEGVFPMRYFPASMLQRFQDSMTKGVQGGGVGMAIGNHDPVFVDDNEAPPGVIAPNPAPFDSMRTEVEMLKKEMFETAGLLLRTESRAAQTAEAKAFDHLEVEQGLRERAQLLQEAEQAAVDMSVAIDANFGAYEPVYPNQFGTRDFVKELTAYVMVGNMMLPDELSKMVQRKLADTVAKMGVPSTPEEVEAVVEAIEQSEAVPVMVPEPEEMEQ